MELLLVFCLFSKFSTFEKVGENEEIEKI